jgi:hypothetical protein
MDWFGFVNQQNIERYRRLLDKCTDEAQRETIFKLLSEEQEKLRTSASEAINAASKTLREVKKGEVDPNQRLCRSCQ